ncbi:DUF1266 domain-containing protein [Streptomyces sp. NPDC050658]|uniref:DUF1266 domain-containing protein n=1 Tax=unclassified Streptomyces TaxID=2593676 RepID=UPI00343EAB5A
MHAPAAEDGYDEHDAYHGEYHDDIFPNVDAPEDGSPWQAPADLEEQLYELAEADDAYTYLRAIAISGLYRPVAMSDVAPGATERPVLTIEIPDGRKVAQLYTSGVLPRPHPEVVYEFVTLGTLATELPDDVDLLVVNAATPCQQFFLTTDEEREVWADLHESHYDSARLMHRVDIRRTGAPESVTLLRGLACGAHLCFTNGDAWNTLDWHGAGYHGEVERLAEWWGVHSREDWTGIQERLLNREVSPWYWDFVLGARLSLIDRYGPRVDPELWRRCVEETLRGRVVEVEGPDAPHRPGDDPELDDFIAAMRGLVGKVLRYEGRFRADGLLAPDGHVTTVAAWDIGRASKMARWGRGARYATHAELCEALERAGGAAASSYQSWEEFSAGYVLGRCLHFDEEEFGDWYGTVLDAHRELVSDPDSPWLMMPLR